MTARRATWLLVVLGACRAPPRVAPATPDPDRIVIVAAERGPQGARLVAIDEHGDRRFVAVAPLTSSSPGEITRDTNPAISPDGKWVVFASSRGRTIDLTSLWIAPLGVEATAVPLIDPVAIDSHPTWSPDGASIVFASTREGGDFDLWRVPVAHGRATGAPVQLTSALGHEVTPVVAPDGTVIYAAITTLPDHGLESHLEARAPDGSIRALTAGPGDSSPALSPDGRVLVFARPAVHAGRADAELWESAPDGTQIQPLVELPLTDESGPVWSPDGRFVFATSVLRGEQGVLFSSVIHVDVREVPRRARILEDHAGAIPRLTPAIARGALDVTALHADPEYLPALARAMASEIERQKTR